MLVSTSYQPDDFSDGWLPTHEVWTYASATTFTVPGDQTLRYSKGTRLKLTQSGVIKYFVVAGSSFSGSTTVTITAGTTYTFVNSTVSDNYYSYQINPVGWPPTFTFTYGVTGFSVNPSSMSGTFWLTGNVFWQYFYMTQDGTSNATTFTITGCPISMSQAGLQSARVANGGTYLTGPGLAALLASGTTITLYKDFSGGTWTASGLKYADFLFWSLI